MVHRGGLAEFVIFRLEPTTENRVTSARTTPRCEGRLPLLLARTRTDRRPHGRPSTESRQQLVATGHGTDSGRCHAITIVRYQSPFTQPTRLDRISLISLQRERHTTQHGPTCGGASAAQSRRAPYWRPTRRSGAAGVLHLHWHLQLWGAVAKRSARRRRETSLESSQRHERPDWQSSSLLHVG